MKEAAVGDAAQDIELFQMHFNPFLLAKNNTIMIYLLLGQPYVRKESEGDTCAFVLNAHIKPGEIGTE